MSSRALLGWASATLAGFVVLATLMGGWFLLAAGSAQAGSCDLQPVAADRVPAALVPIFSAAAARYELGPEGPAVLAGLTKVESEFGRNMGPSSAGATGWTQFMPATWAAYGVDADGDGRRDPMNATDAIHAAARYLRALGAPGDWRKALFGYNHADWYVDLVLKEARGLRSDAGTAAAGCDLGDTVMSATPGRLSGGGAIVEIPWQPGERVDSRLLPDLELLRRRFKIAVTDGYATTGHAADGEHPLGLGVDIVPGPGGSWDDIDRLAAWAEPSPGRPRRPFRWVGYDGDANHGRGHHLHLSWEHGSPAAGHRPPAAWVDVLVARP